MQHIRDIATERSKSDLRFERVKTVSDADLFMAIEGQLRGRHGFVFIRRPEQLVLGPNYFRGAQASVAEHYAYAREIMGIMDEDQLYA